ncbi:MAG: sigma-70 family RNA polymerase sigma factor [Deltaproteobacteria bacterium]|nr:sigma-70 family RNA polymerase sigma factor [Deltaproteobacteria bacterium]
MNAREASSNLASRVSARLDEAARAELAHAPELVESLEAALREGVAAWPAVSVELDRFCAHVAARFPRDSALARLLPRWRLGDLYLAFACAEGSPAARDAFYAEFVPRLRATLRQLRLGAALADELEQELLLELFVGRGGSPPLLAGYSGLGHLSTWLRVVAERTARRGLGHEKRHAKLAQDLLAEELCRDAANPTLNLAKAKYREPFRRALLRALEGLAPKERALLQQRFADGLGLEEIAATQRVHASTIHRRLERLRQTLLERTLAGLAAELEIPTEECSTIVRLLQGSFEVSLRSFFRGPSESNDDAP